MTTYRERLTAPASWWLAALAFGVVWGWIMLVATNWSDRDHRDGHRRRAVPVRRLALRVAADHGRRRRPSGGSRARSIPATSALWSRCTGPTTASSSGQAPTPAPICHPPLHRSRRARPRSTDAQRPHALLARLEPPSGRARRCSGPHCECADAGARPEWRRAPWRRRRLSRPTSSWPRLPRRPRPRRPARALGGSWTGLVDRRRPAGPASVGPRLARRHRQEAPSSGRHPDVTTGEAVAWAVVGGAIIELVKVGVRRGTATYWVKSTGHLPPGMKPLENSTRQTERSRSSRIRLRYVRQRRRSVGAVAADEHAALFGCELAAVMHQEA